MRQDIFQAVDNATEQKHKDIQLSDLPIECLEELLTKFSNFINSSDFFTWYENLFGKIALEILLEDLVVKYRNKKNREELLVLIAASILTSIEQSIVDNIVIDTKEKTVPTIENIDQETVNQITQIHDEIDLNEDHIFPEVILEMFDIESLKKLVDDLTNNLEAGFIDISELSMIVQKLSSRLLEIKEKVVVNVETQNTDSIPDIDKIEEVNIDEPGLDEKIETLELLIESIEFNSKNGIKLSDEEIEKLTTLLDKDDITIDELYEVINDIRNRTLDSDSPLITITETDLSDTNNMKSKLFGDESGFLSIDAIANAVSKTTNAVVKGVSTIGETLGSSSQSKHRTQNTSYVQKAQQTTFSSQVSQSTYRIAPVTTNFVASKAPTASSFAPKVNPIVVERVATRPISNSPSVRNPNTTFAKTPIVIDTPFTSPPQRTSSIVKTTDAKITIVTPASGPTIKVGIEKTEASDTLQADNKSKFIIDEPDGKTDNPKIDRTKKLLFGDQFQDDKPETEKKLTDDDNGKDTIKDENKSGCEKCIGGDCLNCPFGSGGGLDLEPNGGDIPITITTRTKLNVTSEPAPITITPVSIGV